MKIITFQDIHKLNILPEECYAWVTDALQNKADALLPPKISLKPRDGVFCNVMPSMIPTASGLAGGIKAVTRYPDRAPCLQSQILLMDADSGEFLALMDGTWITAMRTGAVAAHSIMLLAKKNYRTIGMMGLGNTARATLMILAAKNPDREYDIKLLKYKDQAQSFMERFSSYPGLHFSIVNTPEEMVGGSDVVISGATYLPDDICADDCFDEGVLVVPIHTLGFTNCDFFFDKVFADDRGHVCHFRNFDKFRKFAEVSDVISGHVPGRESDTERILAYNIGISVHDINFATQIYRRMYEDPVRFAQLPEVDMCNPEQKFWV